jgi:hypothetical protein
MYKNKCAVCGKEMMSYAKDKRGTLPIVYCSKACETNAKYDKRFDKRFK